MDLGVLVYGNKHGFASEVEADWAAVDEIPFDFERRRVSVVLQDLAGGSMQRTLVCKVCNKPHMLLCFCSARHCVIYCYNQKQVSTCHRCATQDSQLYACTAVPFCILLVAVASNTQKFVFTVHSCPALGCYSGGFGCEHILDGKRHCAAAR